VKGFARQSPTSQHVALLRLRTVRNGQMKPIASGRHMWAARHMRVLAAVARNLSQLRLPLARRTL
jgi:hypothetical protein